MESNVKGGAPHFDGALALGIGFLFGFSQVILRAVFLRLHVCTKQSWLPWTRGSAANIERHFRAQS